MFKQEVVVASCIGYSLYQCLDTIGIVRDVTTFNGTEEEYDDLCLQELKALVEAYESAMFIVDKEDEEVVLWRVSAETIAAIKEAKTFEEAVG